MAFNDEFADGFASRGTTTASYLFLDDILRQSMKTAKSAGFPATWGDGDRTRSADYELDPDVAGPDGRDLFGGKYARTIRDDLMSLPTMSLVLNRDDLYGAQGIDDYPL